MSLIPPEVLLAKTKRETAARIAGDQALQSLIVSAQGDIADTLQSIRAQTKIVREIKNEFVATIGEVTARVYSLETVSISDKAAIIDQLNSISVSVGDAANAALAAQASIDELKTVAASQGVAIADQVVRLQSRVGDNVASITEEKFTRATADDALSSLIVTLTATVAGNTAAIVTESTTRATADSALSTRTTTLESQVQDPTTGLLARVTTVESTYATTSYVTAAITAAVSAIVGGAIITVSGTAPTSPAVDDLWVDTSDLDKPKYWDGSAWVYRQDGALAAAVSTESTARATADGYLSGKYTLKVVAGNVVTGMNIVSSTGGGTDVSDVIFQASNFLIYNGTSGIAPFQVVSGVVRVASLSIISSDVSGLAATATSSDFAGVTGTTKPANNADVTLTAINGGLVITSGGITLNGSPSIKSNNYVAGVSGWQIDGAGNAEFQNATIRGTLNATDIIAGTLTVARLPTSVLSANLGAFGSGGTRASSSYGPITLGTPIAVTVTCDGNARKVTYSAAYLANATGSTDTLYLALYMDGTTLIAELANGSGVSLVSGQSIPVEFSGFITPSATSHTFQLYIKSSSGGSTATGGTISVS